MEYFFGKLSEENKIFLHEEESNHLINVRRLKIGEIVRITDGEGQLFISEIRSIEKRACILHVIEKEVSHKKPFLLHLAIAPTKSIDRIEWFLEKATEMGIDQITFLECRHSERKQVNLERLNRIVVSAMKQSLKTFLPILNPIIDFKTFVTQPTPGTKLICSMSAFENETFKKKYQKENMLTAIIGPEGDFHADELLLANENGYEPISLGQSRLRTETAALAVCTLFNFVNSQ